MSGFETDQDSTADLPPIRELSKSQRRVLGVLVEKAFTVPESYPMTLKAVTVGCNQKSNRSPVTNYTEETSLDALDELRSMGLVAVVHTESGRTERYRHYTRKRFPFTEPQLAIITELLLRGRQQLGELRARASRMVPIENQAMLRAEMSGLIEQNYIQANGPLERRGVEVDHCFYLPSENMQMQNSSATRTTSSDGSVPDGDSRSSSTAQISAPPSPPPTSGPDHSQEIMELRESQRELRSELEELRQQLEELKDSLGDLRHSLGA